MTRSDLPKLSFHPDEEICDEITRRIHRYLWQGLKLIEVDVVDGVVTLHGTLDLKSLIPITVRLASAVEGVVRVVDELSFERDDTGR